MIEIKSEKEINIMRNNGKIMKEDILNIIAKPKETEELARHEKAILAEKEQVEEADIEVIPMSPMRKVIAKRMSDSYFTAPTFTLNYEVDMTELISLRKKVMDTIMENTGKKITVTDLISFGIKRSAAARLPRSWKALTRNRPSVPKAKLKSNSLSLRRICCWSSSRIANTSDSTCASSRASKPAIAINVPSIRSIGGKPT